MSQSARRCTTSGCCVHSTTTGSSTSRGRWCTARGVGTPTATRTAARRTPERGAV